jgi:hypothetical protein
MATELEAIVPPATAPEVGRWVERVASDLLRSRAEQVARVEAARFDMNASAPSTASVAQSLEDPDASLAARSAQSPWGRDRSSRRRIASAAALFGMAMGAIAFGTLRSGAKPVAATTDASGENAPSPTMSASPDPPSSLPSASFVAPSASASHSAPPAGVAGAKKVPKPACDPPFVVDSVGRKVWKRGCF